MCIRDRNASKEFDRTTVAKLIEAKKTAGWDFVFLSADMEAFHDAGQMGVELSSRLAFQKSKRGNDAAWAAASFQVRARVVGAADRIEFDNEDRKSSGE